VRDTRSLEGCTLPEDEDEFYFRQITLFIRCHDSIGLELGLGLGLMYKY